MGKRKGELKRTGEGSNIVRNKKNKSNDANLSERKTFLLSKKDNKPPKPVTVLSTEVSKPIAVRIIVGSYEKVLCGIDAKFTQSEEKVNLILLVLIGSISSSLTPCICSQPTTEQ